MTDKDFKVLEEFTKRLLETPISKQEALEKLQSAGIFDKDGNFTPPYRNLERLRQRNK